MRSVPYAWKFKQKVAYAFNDEYLEIARCCLRSDRQKAWVNFDSESFYAPVALH